MGVVIVAVASIATALVILTGVVYVLYKLEQVLVGPTTPNQERNNGI